MKCHLLITCLLAWTVGVSEVKTEQMTTDLAWRVRKTLALQTEVNNRTGELHKAIQADPSKQPRPEDQAALTLAARQKEAMDEADRSITLLEKDGSAVAFVEVFQELRKDMDRVHRRLKAGDASSGTQAIEQDIAETLKEMLEVLTKG